MAPFARVDTVSKASVRRVIPVEGGRFGDGLGAEGHTFKGHGGLDIYGGDGSRTVRAACDCEVIRVEDVRGDEPTSHRGAAGPLWVDTWELDTDGKRTGAVVRYLHLDTVEAGVKPGAKLDAGDKLGTFWEKTFKGHTGHLHFEVRPHDWKTGDGGYGEPIDPKQWLQAKAVRPRVARLVSMLHQEEAYKALKAGQYLWPRSAVKVSSALDSATQGLEDAFLSVSLKVETLPGYPFFTARVIGDGPVSGEVTASLAEALNWVAVESTAWSFRRWGLNYASWKLRVAPLHDAALKNAGNPSLEESRRILSAVAAIRGEKVVEGVARTYGAAAAEGVKAGAAAAKEAVTGVASGLWGGISTEVKVAAGVVIVAGAVALASSSDRS